MKRRALICGVNGQDGSYLAQLLLQKGYEVFGTSRVAQVSGFANLEALGIKEQVQLHSLAANDFRSVLQVLNKTAPHEVYNLAGQSSVSLSFEQPVETMESISIATLNFLEAIRLHDKKIRFYNAGSSECFGDTGDQSADENTPFRPRSPYAVAKAAAFWQLANYREAYGLHACTGILFNHESPLRPSHFVTRKIVTGACKIAAGKSDNLMLGNLHVKRDWGWAPEYVEAMWKMLQLEQPEDFVIGTGESHSLEEFVRSAFEKVGLDWKRFVQTDASLLRPTDLKGARANSAKAKRMLGWEAKLRMHEVIGKMVEAEQAR